VKLLPRIGDITDAARIGSIFKSVWPTTVIHAAAYKHVPMMELSPGEAVKNNVVGTQLVADLAARHRAERFVLVSTDKAVTPSSIMGATKYVAELYVRALAAVSATRFLAVRFGNVLGSAGSVVPIFLEQIAAGGPVTVTDERMVRYFMTIPEACRLTLQAAALGRGGELFVLDMGKPVRIVDLARDLIRLMGREGEIAIEFIGARPGERLREEITAPGEETDPTRYPGILVGRPRPPLVEDVVHVVDQLRRAVDGDNQRAVRDLLLAAEAWAS
jgi:FlaA1/EpsC-like NDP-sugar epimerase